MILISALARRALFVLCTQALCFACTTDNEASRKDSADGPVTRVPFSMDVQVDKTNVFAGDDVTVRCVVRRNGVVVTDVPVRSELIPAAAMVQHSNLHTVFRPTAAGTYRAVCRPIAVEKGAAGQAPGVAIAVKSGAPVQLQGSIASQATAGEAVPYACRAVDAHGNPTAASGVRLAPLDNVADENGSLLFRRAGDYTVRCLGEDLPATEPMQVQVVAGAAYSVQAHVSASKVRAGEWVTVQCNAEDRLRNPTAVGNAYFEVTTDHGESDIQQTAEGFSATLAGSYAVHCLLDQADSTPVGVTIAPGLPHHWNFDAEWDVEDGVCQAQDLPIMFSGMVLDAYNNRCDVALELDVTPRQGVEQASRGFTISGVGTYTLTARVPGPHAPGADVADKVKVIPVDTTPPQVFVTYPPRGAMVQSDDGVVEIRGYVTDETGLTELRVNGTAIEVTPGSKRQDFHIKETRPWGLSQVNVEASDRCRTAVRHSQSYMLSPSYVDPQSDTRQAKALLRVGHLMLHRQDDARTLDTVASILRNALGTHLVNDQISNTLYAYPADKDGFIKQRNYWCRKQMLPESGFEISRSDLVQFSQPRITTLQVEDQKLHLTAEMDNLRVPVEMIIHSDWGCAPPFHTRKSLNAEVLAGSMTVDIKLPTGVDDERIGDPEVWVTFSNDDPRLEVDWTAFRKLGLGGMMSHFSEGMFAKHYRVHLGEEIARQLKAGLADAADAALATLHWEHVIELPAPLQSTVTLQQRVDRVAFEGGPDNGHIAFEVGERLSPRALSVATPESMRPWVKLAEPIRGAIRHPDTIQPFATEVEPALGAMVPDDLINELLWAVWADGGFNIPNLLDVVGMAQPQMRQGLEGSSMSLFAMLPPVLVPSDKARQVTLSWGDIFVQADINTGGDANDHPLLHVSAFVRADFLATLQIDNRTSRLQIDHIEPKLTVQAVEVSNRGQFKYLGSQYLEEWVKVALFDVLAKSINSVPLPNFAVGDLPGVPDNAVWHLRDAQLLRPRQSHQTFLHGMLSAAH